MNRRTLFAALTSVAAFSLAAAAAAQTPDDYPNRPIRIIVPQAAGSGVDQQARVLAQKMSELWGQQGVVENRPGANAIVGMEAGAKAAPDGYTLIYAPVSAVTMNTFIYKKLSYDPLRDFVPIANLGTASFVLVVPESVPVKSLREFVAYAKTRPGELSYAGTSVGSVTHLSTEMFARATGVKMVMVPYAGIPAAMSDLLSGRTQFMSTGVIAALPQIKSGKLRPLAILAPRRHPQLPDVPTIVEGGYPDLTVDTWFGLLAPAGTPPEIVARVNAEIMRALQTPEILEKYRAIGVDAVKPHSPDAFGTLLKSEISRWGTVIREANVKVE